MFEFAFLCWVTWLGKAPKKDLKAEEETNEKIDILTRIWAQKVRGIEYLTAMRSHHAVSHGGW